MGRVAAPWLLRGRGIDSSSSWSQLHAMMLLSCCVTGGAFMAAAYIIIPGYLKFHYRQLLQAEYFLEIISID